MVTFFQKKLEDLQENIHSGAYQSSPALTPALVEKHFFTSTDISETNLHMVQKNSKPREIVTGKIFFYYQQLPSLIREPNVILLLNKHESQIKLFLGPTFNSEPSYFQNVSGVLETVSSKLVVIKFFDGFCHRLAKFVPGQMYINGALNLGSVLKNSFFHSWPDYIK